MKNLRIFVAISLLLAAGCNRPEAEDPVTPEKPKGKYELKELTATLPEADTKSSLDWPTKVVNWSTGDRIVVIGTDGEMHQYQLDAGAGTPVGRFIYVSSKATYTNPSDLTAIYPACAVASTNGSTATIRINSDRSSDYGNYGIKSWNNDSPCAFAQNDIKAAKPSETTSTNTNGLNFKFTQLGTWCRFAFDFTQSIDFETAYRLGEATKGMTVTTIDGDYISGAATLNLTDLSLGTGNEASINWNFASPATLDAPRTYGIMMFPSVSTSSTLHITLRTAQYAFEFYGSPMMDFTPGTTLTFPITVDKNFKENVGALHYTRTSKTQAPFYYYGEQNCYLLTSTATGTRTINATPYSTDIYYHRCNGSAVGATEAQGAKLLWQDDNGLITGVSYNATSKTISYSRTSGHYGNAVIALTDGAGGTGNILWSYHIWCPSATPVDLEYAINGNSEAKTIMSMPLGAVTDIHTLNSNTGGTADGYGCYYQWGRKDPLGRASAVTGYTERNYWDASGTLITPFGAGQSVSLATILEGYVGDMTDANNANYQPMSQFMQNYTRGNPTTFVKTVDGYKENEWAGESDSHFWGNYTSNGSYPRMNKTYKSIFDPCPQGYRVPPEDTWVGFTTTKTTSNNTKYWEWNMAHNGVYDSSTNTFAGDITSDGTYRLQVARGYAFYYQGYGSGSTDFYAASGFRNLSTGAIGRVGDFGYCWSSTSGGAAARHLAIHSTFVIPSNSDSHTHAFTVRCAKEP